MSAPAITLQELAVLAERGLAGDALAAAAYEEIARLANELRRLGAPQRYVEVRAPAGELNDAQKRALAEKLLGAVDEMTRLEKLSPLALVAECLKTSAADHDVVLELMNRVQPGWEELLVEGELPKISGRN